MSCQLKCSENEEQKVDDISNRVMYIASPLGGTSEEEKSITQNVQTDYDAEDMPDLVAAIKLSLQPRSMEEQNMEEKFTQLPLKEENGKKAQPEEVGFDFRPLLRKALSLTRGLDSGSDVCDVSKVQTLSTLKDASDQKEPWYSKRYVKETEEVFDIKRLLGDLQGKYDKKELEKPLAMLCKIFMKILENPKPMTEVDRTFGNIRTIKRDSRGFSKVLALNWAEEILKIAGFCVNHEKNWLELKPDALNAVRFKSIINCLSLTLAEVKNDATLDIFHRGVTLEVLQSVLKLYMSSSKVTRASWDGNRLLSPGESFVHSIVIPATKKWKCSYVEKLRKNVGIVNVFISHAWKYEFEDLVDSIENYERDKKDGVKRYYFLDYLAVNQNRDGDQSLAPNDLKDLEPLVKQVKEFVLVLSPWHTPIPLTRSWCVLEMATAKAAEVEFFISMPTATHEAFIENLISQGSVIHVFKRLDTERAEASVPEDQAMIKDKILKELNGFENLNVSLAKYLRQWFGRKLIELDQHWPTGENETMKQILFLQKAAKFFHESGNIEKALIFAKRSVRIGEKVLGTGHLETLRSKYRLSQIYNDKQMTFAPLKLLREILERALDCHFTNLEVVNWLSKLGTVLGSGLKRMDLAFEIYRECLKALSPISVTKDKDKELLRTVLEIKTNLAGAYGKNRKEALWLYSEVYEKGVEAFGPDDQLVMATTSNLAVILSSTGREREALQLFLELIKHQIKIFGKEDLRTITTEYNIASIFILINRLEEATERTHCLCEKARRVLGHDHILTKRANRAVEELRLKWALSEH